MQGHAVVHIWEDAPVCFVTGRVPPPPPPRHLTHQPPLLGVMGVEERAATGGAEELQADGRRRSRGAGT